MGGGRIDPAQFLDDAWRHIARTHQRGLGRYDLADLEAMILLDLVQQTFAAEKLTNAKKED